VRIHKTPTVGVSTVRKKQTKLEVPRYLEVDEETAFILGLYAAEGSCEKHRVTFTINSKRTDLVENIRAWSERAFPVVTVALQVKPRGTAVNVRIHASLFADLICEMVP
jgi:hypothetical protein